MLWKNKRWKFSIFSAWKISCLILIDTMEFEWNVKVKKNIEKHYFECTFKGTNFFKFLSFFNAHTYLSIIYQTSKMVNYQTKSFVGPQLLCVFWKEILPFKKKWLKWNSFLTIHQIVHKRLEKDTFAILKSIRMTFQGISLILDGFGLQKKKVKVKNLSYVKRKLVSYFQIATKILLKSLIMNFMKLQLEN
jgi:hypothetical protein